MISHVSIATIYVSDQDRALAFYTEKLGFELVQDVNFGPSQRWVQVRPPGAETDIVLYTPDGQEDRIGTFAGIVFTADDVEKTYEELAARGVEFTQKPTKEPWGGTQALFKDPDGNTYSLHS